MATGIEVGLQNIGSSAIKVLHPRDLLQGRLENLYGLPEKQDEHGLAQLILAIEVIQKFLLFEGERTSSAPGRSAALKHVSRIEEMALSDAGRKVAKRFGVHVADAIEPMPLAHVPAFMKNRVPQLLALTSPARREELHRRPEIGEYR